MSDKLHELRDAIDRIDAEILQLIRHRMILSDEIIEAKNGEAAFRPGREAALVRRLARWKATSLPPYCSGFGGKLWQPALLDKKKI